jgi:hypothetical protein
MVRKIQSGTNQEIEKRIGKIKDDALIRFYHGTSPENAAKIIKEKRLLPDDLNKVGLSTDYYVAKDYSRYKSGKDGVVLSVYVRKSELGIPESILYSSQLQGKLKGLKSFGSEIGGTGKDAILVAKHGHGRGWELPLTFVNYAERKRQKDGSWAVVTTEKGKPMKMYHGTRVGEIDTFIKKYKPTQQMGFGVHFTPNKELAEMYAYDEMVARKGKHPFVNERYLDINKLLDARQIVKEGSQEFSLAKKLAGVKFVTVKDEKGVPSAYLQNAIDATSPQRAEKILKEYGYDGVIYDAKVRKHGGYIVKEAPTYVVLDPSQIKKGGYTKPVTKPVTKAKREAVSVGGVR